MATRMGMNVSKRSERLDQVLTILTVCVVTVFATLTVSGSFKDTAMPEQRLKKGQPFVAPGLGSSTSQRTLVLALQPDCAYCGASSRFYRDILHTVAQSDEAAPAIVVLSPYSDEANREMLKAYDLDIDVVHQADFSTLGISGTPTLVLLNAAGLIEQTWIGQLSAEQELAVFEALGTPRAASSSGSEISPMVQVDLAALSDADVVLDTRDRAAFRLRHVVSAVNVPLDELEVRASREMSRNARVLLVCESKGCSPTPTSTTGYVPSSCEIAVALLREEGFDHVDYVKSDFSALEANGIRLAQWAE